MPRPAPLAMTEITGLSFCSPVIISKSEDCNNCAVVGGSNVLLDGIGHEGLDKSLELLAVFVTLAAGDDVGVGLGCVTGGVLQSKSVGRGEAGLQSVVAVDDGDGAGVAVFKLCGNGVSLNGLDVVAAIIDDVEVADALLSGGILGQGDQAFLLEQEQCAGLVGVVSGDNDGCAFGAASTLSTPLP